MGVVGVVIIEHRAVVLPLVLKAAVSPAEGVQSLSDGVHGDVQLKSGSGGSQGIAHVVDAGHPQGQSGKGLALIDQVKGGQPLVPGEVGGVDIPLLQTEGEHGFVQPLQGVHGVGVVPVGHHAAPLGNQLSKAAEGVLHILQILEKVQVVGVHVKDDGDGGEEGEKGVAVLAGLQNNGVPLAHPVAGSQDGEHTADHHSGVPLGGQEDMGAHGGGGGFSVGARHAQGVLIVAHNGAPGLSPLKDRDTGGPGGGDLRVVVVDGGGADDAVRPPDALRQVADDHGDAQGTQMLHRLAVMEVRAGDVHPRAVEYLGQRGHGDAADAHQMGVLAGADIVMNIRVHHETPRNDTNFSPHERYGRQCTSIIIQPIGNHKKKWQNGGQKSARCQRHRAFSKGETHAEKVKESMI